MTAKILSMVSKSAGPGALTVAAAGNRIDEEA
jgi:hypothetical protein